MKHKINNVMIIAALTILLTVNLPGYATLSQVNLISQNHLVQGYADLDEMGTSGVTYYKADTIPVEGSCSSPLGSAYSKAGDLKVDGFTGGGNCSYWGEASSWYVFYPYITTLDFSITESCTWSGAPYGSSFSYYLKDLETSAVISEFQGDDDFIFSQRIGDNNFSEWEYNNQFSVSTDHRYELYLFIHADAMDGTAVTMIADIVPEPATAIILLAGMLITFSKIGRPA